VAGLHSASKECTADSFKVKPFAYVMFCFQSNAEFVERYQSHIMPFVWNFMRCDISSAQSFGAGIKCLQHCAKEQNLSSSHMRGLRRSRNNYRIYSNANQGLSVEFGA
jgi:hypothetical protein